METAEKAVDVDPEEVVFLKLLIGQDAVESRNERKSMEVQLSILFAYLDEDPGGVGLQLLRFLREVQEFCSVVHLARDLHGDLPGHREVETKAFRH